MITWWLDDIVFKLKLLPICTNFICFHLTFLDLQCWWHFFSEINHKIFDKSFSPISGLHEGISYLVFVVRFWISLLKQNKKVLTETAYGRKVSKQQRKKTQFANYNMYENWKNWTENPNMLLYTWANTFTSTGVKFEKWQSLWLISIVLCQPKWIKKKFQQVHVNACAMFNIVTRKWTNWNLSKKKEKI